MEVSASPNDRTSPGYPIALLCQTPGGFELKAYRRSASIVILLAAQRGAEAFRAHPGYLTPRQPDPNP